MRFKFVGSESWVGGGATQGVRLNHHGQLVDLDAEMAHTCIVGGVGLLPEDMFDSIGFTEDEMEMHSDYDQHRIGVIDPGFAEKKRKSHGMFVRYMQDYLKAVAVGDTFMAREEKVAKQTAPATVIDSHDDHQEPDLDHEEPPVEHDFSH